MLITSRHRLAGVAGTWPLDLGTLDTAAAVELLAAALLDLPSEQAHAILEQLVDVHLLQSPTPAGYRIHPLLRLFAAEQTDVEEPTAHHPHTP